MTSLREAFLDGAICWISIQNL